MARQRAAGALAAVIGLLAAGCSGSGNPSASRSATTGPSASRPRLSAAPSSAPGSSAGGQRPAPPAVVAAVRSAYVTFFSSKSAAPQVQASLQNGARFHATILAEGKSQYASSSAARVRSVELLSPQVAAVSYDILSDGAVVLKNVNGHAVDVHGHWLVAAETFCQLLKLEGNAPSACSDPSATALPS